MKSTFAQRWRIVKWPLLVCTLMLIVMAIFAPEQKHEPSPYGEDGLTDQQRDAIRIDCAANPHAWRCR